MRPDNTGDQVLELLARRRRKGIPDSLRDVAWLLLDGESAEGVKAMFGETSAHAFNCKVAENLRNGRATHDQASAVRRTLRAVERLLADAPLTGPQREHLVRLEVQLLVGAAHV